MSKRIIIVEDEALIADQLENLLTDLGYDCVGMADCAEDLYELLKENEVDLILLDINLGTVIDGIDIAHTLNHQYQIPFIFITSNTDQKTLERVKLTQPSGFIIKPFSAVHVKTEIELGLSKHQHSVPSNEKDTKDYFFIKSNQRLDKVLYDDLIYLEANDNFCLLYTKMGRLTYGYPLKQAEEKLSAHANFMRVHRSYIVNLSHIEQLKGKVIILSNQKEIPFSENMRSELYDKLNLF